MPADAQGPAVRHRVHLQHLHPRARRGGGAAGGESAAGAARHEREGLHRLVPAVLRADPDDARYGGDGRLPAPSRARSSSSRCTAWAAARSSCSVQGDRNARVVFENAHRLRRALRHRAALHPRHRADGRLAGAADRWRAGAVRARAHPRRRRSPRQPRRGRARRRPPAERPRPLARRADRPGAGGAEGCCSSAST